MGFRTITRTGGDVFRATQYCQWERSQWSAETSRTPYNPQGIALNAVLLTFNVYSGNAQRLSCLIDRRVIIDTNLSPL